jgi:hypothetical protein
VLDGAALIGRTVDRAGQQSICRAEPAMARGRRA